LSPVLDIVVTERFRNRVGGRDAAASMSGGGVVVGVERMTVDDCEPASCLVELYVERDS
jgi:hypothetical protein